MFRLGEKKGGTWKEVKKHVNAKQQSLSAEAKKTLGSGNLRAAVRCPPDENKEEWIAMNTVDFYNEISLLYGLVADQAAMMHSQPGEGFPVGFEYLWQVTAKEPPIRCSSPDYVEYVMHWVGDQINNELIFPVDEDVPFPDDFMNYVRDIYKRLFRIFAIMYHANFSLIAEYQAVAHLNTCFKHFAFFALEFDLLEEKEIKALAGPFQKMKECYLEGN